MERGLEQMNLLVRIAVSGVLWLAGKARFWQQATSRTQLPVSVMDLSGEFFRLVMVVAFFVFFLSHR